MLQHALHSTNECCRCLPGWRTMLTSPPRPAAPAGGDAGSPYEVMVALVACKDLPAGASIQFPLLAGSVGT